MAPIAAAVTQMSVANSEADANLRMTQISADAARYQASEQAKLTAKMAADQLAIARENNATLEAAAIRENEFALQQQREQIAALERREAMLAQEREMNRRMQAQQQLQAMLPVIQQLQQQRQAQFALGAAQAVQNNLVPGGGGTGLTVNPPANALAANQAGGVAGPGVGNPLGNALGQPGTTPIGNGGIPARAAAPRSLVSGGANIPHLQNGTGQARGAVQTSSSQLLVAVRKQEGGLLGIASPSAASSSYSGRGAATSVPSLQGLGVSTGSRAVSAARGIRSPHAVRLGQHQAGGSTPKNRFRKKRAGNLSAISTKLEQQRSAFKFSNFLNDQAQQRAAAVRKTKSPRTKAFQGAYNSPDFSHSKTPRRRRYLTGE